MEEGPIEAMPVVEQPAFTKCSGTSIKGKDKVFDAVGYACTYKKTYAGRYMYVLC